MKRLFALFAFLLLAPALTHAQAIPATQAPLPQQTEEYCELRLLPKFLNFKRLFAYIDFGYGEAVLKDETGNDVEFVSSVAALNYMNSKGWKLVDVHARISDGSSCTYYLMKRSLEQ